MGLFDKITKKILPAKFEIDKGNPEWVNYKRAGTLGGMNGSVKRTDPSGAASLDNMWKEDNPGKVNPYVRSMENKAVVTPTLMPSNMKNVVVNSQQVLGTNSTRKQEKVPSDFYDASQKYGDAMGVPKEVILANSRWEHRNNKNWNEGKYVDNVWWNAEKNTGEESYGPGQINMRWFGPEAVKLGRITTEHPLYITPEQAKDPWGAAEWMAKKFSAEAKRYTNKGLEPDWGAILQGYNSNETDRGKNVKGLIDSTDFVRS